MPIKHINQTISYLNNCLNDMKHYRGITLFRNREEQFAKEYAMIEEKIAQIKFLLYSLKPNIRGQEKRMDINEEVKDIKEIANGLAFFISSSSRRELLPDTIRALKTTFLNINKDVGRIHSKTEKLEKIVMGEEIEKEEEEDPYLELKQILTDELRNVFNACNLPLNHPLLAKYSELVQLNPPAARLELPKIAKQVRNIWMGVVHPLEIEGLVTEVDLRIKNLKKVNSIEKESHIAPLNKFLHLAGEVRDDDLEEVWTGAAYLLPQLLTLKEDDPSVMTFTQHASYLADGLTKKIADLMKLKEKGLFSMDIHGYDYQDLKTEILSLYSIRGFCEILVPINEYEQRKMSNAQIAFKKFLAKMENKLTQTLVDIFLEHGQLIQTELDRSRFSCLIPAETLRRIKASN